MSSRLISWRQEVLNADPEWTEENYRPKTYYFSNGRIFRRPTDPYNPVAYIPLQWDNFRWDAGYTWG